MGVNKIMFRKIVDVKYDLIALHMHHGCVKQKRNWRNGCMKWKWEWKDSKKGKNEKKREMRKGMTL